MENSMKMKLLAFCCFTLMLCCAAAAQSTRVGTRKWSAQSAQSAQEMPLLEKKLIPGFAPVEDQLLISCQIFPEKILLTRGLPGLLVKTSHPHQLFGEVLALIAAASKGALTAHQLPVDLPITTYSAFYPAPHDAGGEVKLYAQVYRGEMIYRNESREATRLKNFLDIHCNF
jgi:hypothetical protein